MDIVEEARALALSNRKAAYACRIAGHVSAVVDGCEDAARIVETCASEIERLRAEIERLKGEV